MLLEPMYLLMGRNFAHDDTRYGFEVVTEEEATSVIFASEPLTDGDDGWSHVEFGEIVFLEKEGEHVSRRVARLEA
jgi:glutamine amidotransferase